MPGLLDGLLGALAEAPGVALIGLLVQPCGRARLTVTVADPINGGRPVEDAYVRAISAVGTWSGRTDNRGRVSFDVYPATFILEARKDWFLPDPVERLGVVVADQADVHQLLPLEELRFYLHVDADRDGQVDDAWTTNPTWVWGANGTGAVMLCNNDDDDVQQDTDHADEVINGGNDNTEIAPLEVRRHGSRRQPPQSWTGTLEIREADTQNARIFATNATGAAAVIGPIAGNSVSLNNGTLRGYAGNVFGIEALRYAEDEFNGFVDVTLTVSQAGEGVLGLFGLGGRSYHSSARFRVAPWLMPNHLDEAHTVYVSDVDATNAAFRLAVGNAVRAVGCNFVEHAVNGDQWMQDCMEIGYAVLPAAPRPLRRDSVLRPPRGNELSPFPESLLAADFGFHEQGPILGVADHGSTFDSCGNIEVTPPVRDSQGNEYPWGRIYYCPGNDQHPHGPAMDEELRAFLTAQVVQSPIEIDATWLIVGHADELISFVPYAAGAPFKQWKLLVVSPREAYRILDAVHLVDPNRVMLRNRTAQYHNVQGTVADYVAGNAPIMDPAPHGANTIPAGTLRNFNLNVIQPLIDAVLTQLEDDVDLTQPADVIEVPVLFIPEDANWTVAGALTADMVNMLVVNNRCVVPKPFGVESNLGADLFEHDLRTKLNALGGLTVTFVDDWALYQARHGEVHCGTNTLRRPANAATWAASAAARWWEFEP